MKTSSNLIIVFILFWQMSNVNVYAAVPDIESDMWSDIATAALKLDRDDFLDSGYHVDADEFPQHPLSQSTPSTTRPRTRSTVGSPSSRPEKRRVTYEEDEEEEQEEEEEEEGLDAMLTPGAPQSDDLPGSSASLGPPVPGRHSVTPANSILVKAPCKKEEGGSDGDHCSDAAIHRANPAESSG